jgi:Tol biopolymer transport system component
MDSFGRFVTMSPDSQAVYFTRTLRSSTDALFSISLQDGQPHEIFTHYGYLPPLAISPDGSQLYALIDSLTRIHIPSNTVEPLAYSTTSPSIDILNWSANQEWMVIQEFNDKNYFVYRIRADGQNPQLLLGTARRLRSAHPSPDGLWILVEIEADLGTDLIRLPATGDGPSVPLPMGQFRGWTDNGATFLLHLLENSNQTTLCRMQLATGECLNIIPDVDSVIAQSPTADQILYIHRDQTNQRQYFLVNADSTHQQQIAYGNSIRFGDWSTDGQWLYFDEQDDQHAVLFRINATTGQRQDIHQPYGDNNSHRIFQSFLPLYQTDSSLFGSLILSAALLMIESFLSLPIPRRTGQ